MTEALLNKLVPYSADFPEALSEYCEKAGDAIRENKHHDHRRHLFIRFLGRGLGIKVDARRAKDDRARRHRPRRSSPTRRRQARPNQRTDQTPPRHRQMHRADKETFGNRSS